MTVSEQGMYDIVIGRVSCSVVVYVCCHNNDHGSDDDNNATDGNWGDVINTLDDINTFDMM